MLFCLPILLQTPHIYHMTLSGLHIVAKTPFLKFSGMKNLDSDFYYTNKRLRYVSFTSLIWSITSEYIRILS